MSKRSSKYSRTVNCLDSIMEVHENDVLSGKGASISNHRGNERFRSLVQERYDPTYCKDYTAAQKTEKAKEIIHIIQSSNPPGRFLKRSKHARNAKGLHGPWEVLSSGEAVKKTRQALRDCNRPDRAGYAAHLVDEEISQSLGSAAGTMSSELAFTGNSDVNEDSMDSLFLSEARATGVHMGHSSVTPSTIGASNSPLNVEDPQHYEKANYHHESRSFYDPEVPDIDINFDPELGPSVLDGLPGFENDPLQFLSRDHET